MHACMRVFFRQNDKDKNEDGLIGGTNSNWLLNSKLTCEVGE